MSRLFAYRATGRTPRSDAAWLVVFCPDDELPQGDLFDLLSDDIGTNLQPDALVFIVRENAAVSIATALKALGTQDWRVPVGTTSVSVVGFSSNGSRGSA